MATTKTKKPILEQNGDGTGPDALDVEVREVLREFLKPIEKRYLLVTITGDTPLITNQIPERTRRELLDKNHGIKRKPEEKPAPLTEQEAFEQAVYRNDLGEACFPARGVHKAIWSALPTEEESDEKARIIRQAFVVYGDLLAIRGSEPVLRQDPVRNWNARGVLAIATRAYFRRPWSMLVPVCYDDGCRYLSRNRLLVLLNRAGFFPGIGAWRGDCRGGLFGRFHVTTAQECSLEEFEAAL